MHTDISSPIIEPEDNTTPIPAKDRSYSTARDRLTPLGIKRLSKPDLYHDGGGLYLQVSHSKRQADGATGPEINKSWVFRYRLQGRLRSMGIGSFHDVTLAEAREQARKLRQTVSDKRDPIDEREQRARELALQRATEVTFKDCAEEYHLREAPKWKNAKHAAQWINTLRTYAFPKLGNKMVHNIGKTEVQAVLSPIWEAKPETASRVKQRMRSVLEWAASMDRYPNYNHGMWDILDKGLGKGRSEERKRKNHAACPIGKVSELIATLYQTESQPIVKLAFEFTVLTAARSGETRLMPWGEYAKSDQLWKIPAERMKAGKEHRVPLSARCVEILSEAKEITGGMELVFCHPKTGKAFSDAVFTSLLHKGLGLPYTMHGFRSTFRDWGAEMTDHQRELLEVALAHLPGDQTEQAYWRSDVVSKRRKLMDDWAGFVQSNTTAR
jgi:integrase